MKEILKNVIYKFITTFLHTLNIIISNYSYFVNDIKHKRRFMDINTNKNKLMCSLCFKVNTFI